MPATFVIHVDLTAPQITWGTPSGTLAGEVLRVPYTVDESGVIAAELVLHDGRHVAGTILPDRLEFLLPVDLESGTGTVHASTRDDVDNEAAFELLVALDGVLQTPSAPPGPSGGRPAGIAARPKKYVSTRSAARARDADEVQRRPTRIRVRARGASDARVGRVVVFSEALHTADSAQVSHVSFHGSSSRAAPGTTKVRRGVGESIAALLL